METRITEDALQLIKAVAQKNFMGFVRSAIEWSAQIYKQYDQIKYIHAEKKLLGAFKKEVDDLLTNSANEGSARESLANEAGRIAAGSFAKLLAHRKNRDQNKISIVDFQNHLTLHETFVTVLIETKPKLPPVENSIYEGALNTLLDRQKEIGEYNASLLNIEKDFNGQEHEFQEYQLKFQTAYSNYTGRQLLPTGEESKESLVRPPLLRSSVISDGDNGLGWNHFEASYSPAPEVKSVAMTSPVADVLPAGRASQIGLMGMRGHQDQQREQLALQGREEISEEEKPSQNRGSEANRREAAPRLEPKCCVLQ